MKIRVSLKSTNEPDEVTIELPNWSLGGTRQTIKVSFYEAFEIYKQLKKILDYIGDRE